MGFLRETIHPVVVAILNLTNEGKQAIKGERWGEKVRKCMASWKIATRADKSMASGLVKFTVDNDLLRQHDMKDIAATYCFTARWLAYYKSVRCLGGFNESRI